MRFGSADRQPLRKPSLFGFRLPIRVETHSPMKQREGELSTKCRGLAAFAECATPLVFCASCASGTSIPPVLDAGSTGVSTGVRDTGVDSAAFEAGSCSLPMNTPLDQNSLRAGQLLLTAS